MKTVMVHNTKRKMIDLRDEEGASTGVSSTGRFITIQMTTAATIATMTAGSAIHAIVIGAA